MQVGTQPATGLSTGCVPACQEHWLIFSPLPVDESPQWPWQTHCPRPVSRVVSGTQAFAIFWSPAPNKSARFFYCCFACSSCLSDLGSYSPAVICLGGVWEHPMVLVRNLLTCSAIGSWTVSTSFFLLLFLFILSFLNIVSTLQNVRFLLLQHSFISYIF